MEKEGQVVVDWLARKERNRRRVWSFCWMRAVQTAFGYPDGAPQGGKYTSPTPAGM